MNIIHLLDYDSPKVQASDKYVIMPYAVVNVGTILRQTCIINIGVLVDSDCILDKGGHIVPRAIVKGENHFSKETKVDLGEIIPLQFYK